VELPTTSEVWTCHRQLLTEWLVGCLQGSSGCTPVCERLHQQCLNSRDCLLVMLRQRDQQLAAATAALATAEARAAAAEAKAAAAGGGHTHL